MQENISVTRDEQGVTYRATHTSDIVWSMLNQNSQLIPATLVSTAGDATYKTFAEITGFEPPLNNDGVMAVNYVMHFKATGRAISIRNNCASDVALRYYQQEIPDRPVRHLIHHNVAVQSPAGTTDTIATAEIWMVLTRPFMSAEHRRIATLPPIFDVLESSPLPDTSPALLDLTAYICEMGDALWQGEFHFGLAQTDLFQHVYSLQYFRIAESLLVQYLARNGVGTTHYWAETRAFFRRPFHAGTCATVRVWQDPDDQNHYVVGFYHDSTRSVSVCVEFWG